MSHRNGLVRHPPSRPGPVFAARATEPKTDRNLGGDQAAESASRHVPRELPSNDDIDEQIRRFFERGLV